MHLHPRILIFVLAAVCAAPIQAVSPAEDSLAVLGADEYRHLAVRVEGWDPESVQRLVRIGSRMYQEDSGSYYPVIPDQISVRLAEGVESWDGLVLKAERNGGRSFRLLASLVPLRSNRLGIVDLAVPEGSDLVAWCELVHRTGLVRYAEVATRGEYLVVPNDPRYPEQWALHNTGQTGGTPGADLDAPIAWDLTAGAPGTVVAILDSGTDVDHQDLAPNVWHNPGEIPGNGQDDDGNGYVDDWEGWDFEFNNNDPRSSNSHGTYVTGIVNARGGNGIGIAGVAGGIGSAGVQGMALGIGSSGPVASVMDDAILYAADNGADVITISSALGETQAINDALAYAYNTKDVFIDCASGNDSSAVRYPATRQEVVAVASTDHNDARSWFSNYGPEIEVAAPGSDILSTAPGDLYLTDSGTSFAAPQVAGVAGLVRSRNPGLPAVYVRQTIRDSAEDVGATGFDNLTGHGRVNAYQAILAASISDGTVTLDRPGFACSADPVVTVMDFDLAGAGSLAVTVRSETEPGGDTATLPEQGTGSGLFVGSFPIASGPALPDGTLQVSHGDTLVVEYLDADDGAGGADVLKTDEAWIDCLPPVITAVGSENLTDTTARIVWTTDESSNSLVRYGETTPPTLEQTHGIYLTQHAVDLGGLAECTTYRYEVESADGVANRAADDNGGSYYSFETLGNFPGIGIQSCSLGQVALDRDGTYGCSEAVSVQVIDKDLNADPNVVESVPVVVSSTAEPVGETVWLTEAGADSSRFDGSITLDPGPAVGGDGLLAAGTGDLVTATYEDADNGQGVAVSATDSSTTDCEPPFISGITVSDLSSTRAVVQWTTSEPATTRVEFGPTAALGSVLEDLALSSSHSVVVSPFDGCDRVHFRILSADQHGAVRVADAGGSPFAFNMNRIGGLVFHDNLETDTGWTLPGEWERGTPAGLGTNGGDPESAWSGSYAIGSDLSGQGAYPGDYEPSTSDSALSPVFSTRQERNLELIIRRKLGVTTADEAGIYIITNGTDLAWTSNYTVQDTDWVEYRKGIGAWADNKNSVQIEFRLESSDPDHSFGWNIDEIIVKDSTQPDYLVCGGCTGGPAFAGVSGVYDPDPCAAGGLVVEWEPAPAWGTGGPGTYDVHRGSTPDFVPSDTNRVATGLTGTSWTDAGAGPDTPFWYVVRARNDESCTGGEGLADGNLVRIEATETTSRPLPGPVGDVLTAWNVGGAHVRLEWAVATGADHYRVLRGEAVDFSDAVEIGTTQATFFEDAGAVGSPAAYYAYRVLAVDACGRQE